jgi:hypothetical protein
LGPLEILSQKWNQLNEKPSRVEKFYTKRKKEINHVGKRSRIEKSNSHRRLTSNIPVHANPQDHCDFGKEYLSSH